MPLYSIAGLIVSMEPRHVLSVDRAEPYRTQSDRADIVVKGEGDVYEEYASLARSFYEQLLGFDGFLLHSSAVEIGGKAVAFSAPSGTGKSTHASFWRKILGATVINDDKPAIRSIDGVFCACGTPFSGKTDQNVPICVPLHAVVFLKRAPQTSVRRLSTQEALFLLLGQTLRPSDSVRYNVLLTLIEDMLNQVSVYEAGVPLDEHSAKDVYNAVMGD